MKEFLIFLAVTEATVVVLSMPFFLNSYVKKNDNILLQEGLIYGMVEVFFYGIALYALLRTMLFVIHRCWIEFRVPIFLPAVLFPIGIFLPGYVDYITEQQYLFYHHYQFWKFLRDHYSYYLGLEIIIVSLLTFIVGFFTTVISRRVKGLK